MKSGIAGSRSYFVQVYELVERVSQLPIEMSANVSYEKEDRKGNQLPFLLSHNHSISGTNPTEKPYGTQTLRNFGDPESARRGVFSVK